MINELKPVAYLLSRGGTALVYARDVIKKIDPNATPLYAIPEGYHIVAIDSEQELRDNLERHNEKVRSDHEDNN